ncbi:MAG: putative TIM-barrel fold metal-dependent hydrolase [Arenicella sp.]
MAFPYPIYDAHHHLWDLAIVDYPWLTTRGIVRFFGDPAPIQKNYLVEDLKSDIGMLPVQGSVHIQVGADATQHLLESQTVQSFADASNLANGIVAFCALEHPDRNAMLDSLSELNNFRGVRQIVGRSPEEDKQTGTGSLLNNPEWLEGLYELERRSLSFDLQLIPEQMQQAAEVFAQVPSLSVAVCHCGSPWYRDKKGWALWKDGLTSLAELPNIHCKISGLSMFDHHWTVDSLRPIIDTVLDIFGAERCMFGSNFPVDKLHTSYERLWMAYLEIVESYRPARSESQKRALFKDNCAAFYRLG